MMKICKECLLEKENEDFYGRRGDCKECAKKSSKEHRENNKEYYKNYLKILV